MEEQWVLFDLFSHVLSGRANRSEVQALIDYLEEQKQLIGCEPVSPPAPVTPIVGQAWPLPK